MNERRLARLREQIKQRLAQVLQRDLADPKLGLVTITRIELDKEFTRCKAYWSVLAASGKEERAQRDSAAVLERARGYCQREMAAVLYTRTVPHLEFVYDKGIVESVRMRRLLEDLTRDLPDRGDGSAEPDEPTEPPDEGRPGVP